MRRTPLILVALLAAAGCDMPSPQAPAPPIGELPVWGQGFGQDAAQPSAGSLLQQGHEGPAPTGGEGNTANAQGGSATPNQDDPFAKEDWGGGDATYGKQVFLNNCARCHGPEGKGGEVVGVGVVPTLRDVGWHERTTDKQIASTIAHGKNAMPGFMQSLDGKQLRGVIAFLRSLKGG